MESRGKLEARNDSQALFGFVIKGQIAAAVKNNRESSVRKLMSGELFYISPNCRYTIHNPMDYSASLLLVSFEIGNPSRSSEGAGLPDTERGKLYKCPLPQVQHWAADFLNAGGEGEPALYYQVQSHLYAMASSLITYLQYPKTEEGDLQGYVQQIKQSMLDNYDRDVDIEKTARLSGVSASRFYQAFKQYTGLSPHKYMTFVRMNASLSLLAGSPSSIMSVAHSVGYTDELYFSRLFKKHMGMTPSEYNQAAQKRIAVLSANFQGDLSVLGITPHLILPEDCMDHPESCLEQLESCHPELVLAPPLPKDIRRIIADRFPVEEIEWGGCPWKERLRSLSLCLGIPSVAERWLNYYEVKAANAKAHARGVLNKQPFLLASTEGNRFRVYGMLHCMIKELFYDDLSLVPPAWAEQMEYRDVSSLEELADLDCDNVLFLIPSSLSETYRSKLEDDWISLGSPSARKHCLIIHHPTPPLYNASSFESLIDGMIDQLQYGKIRL